MARPNFDGLGAPRVPRGFVSVAEGLGPGERPAPVTVLRAPRGWGKTATAAAWLRSLEAHHDIVWISLAVPTDGPDLGRLIDARLDEIGIEGTWADLPHIGPALGRLGRRLVLVIDNAHLLGGTAIDEALLDAAERNERLHVVALTRVERTLEFLARIDPDCRVVGVPELRLSAQHTGQIAHLLGMPLTHQEAADVTARVGGWPALVRACLSSGPAAHLHQETIEHYLTIALEDAPADPAFDVALRASPAREVTAETAPMLGLGGPAPEVLALLDHSGLTDRGQLSALVHACLARIYARTDPAAFAQAHLSLSAQAHRQGLDGEALRHAVEAGRPARVRSLLRSNWLTVADQPDLARTAIRMVERDGAEDVRLLILRRHLGMDAGLLDRVPRGDEQLPQELATWGLARVQTMDLATGERALQEAFDHAERLGATEVAQRARVSLAYARALGGAVAGARSMLRSCADLPATRHLRQLTGEIIAMDTLEWDTSTPQPLDPLSLAVTDPGTPAAEETLIGAAIALERAIGHTPVPPNYVLAVQTQLQLLGPGSSQELVKTCVVAALMSAMLAEGRVREARGLASRTLTNRQARDWLTLRAAFYAGDFDAVLTGSESDVSVTAGGSVPRVALEILLLRACALSRLYQVSEAADAFHAAVSVAQTHGLMRPLLFLPRSDLHAIAATTPQLQEFLEQLPAAGRAGLFGLPAVRGSLSQSELRVLKAISDGAPVSLAATRLFVSVNTVKTQLRSIYRKLGVHNRDDALRRTRELGLLQEGTPRDGDLVR